MSQWLALPNTGLQSTHNDSPLRDNPSLTYMNHISYESQFILSCPCQSRGHGSGHLRR